MFGCKLIGRKLVHHAILACLLAALVSIAHGGYLLLKAHLAQYLLNSAWQQQTVIKPMKTSASEKPWFWADFYPVAKLTFERFNISQIVLNNDSGQALAFGPGLNQIKATGVNSTHLSTFVISAHNDTHFSFLDELEVNDQVTLTLKDGKTQKFTVNAIKIIDTKTEELVVFFEEEQSDVSNRNKTRINELILVTCYPFGGVDTESTLRYVIRLS